MDCKKAATRVEQEICADPALLQFDADLAKAYRGILDQFPRSEDQQSIRQQQRHWLLRVRNTCLDATCLKAAYQVRIAFLDPRRFAADPNAQFLGLSLAGGKTTALGRLRIKPQFLEIEMLAPGDVIAIPAASPGARTVTEACKADRLCQVSGVVRKGENLFYSVEHASAAE